MPPIGIYIKVGKNPELSMIDGKYNERLPLSIQGVPKKSDTIEIILL
jgi:hypothetical protein